MKIALITTPRTGSTWLYRILLDNLSSNDPQATGFTEYFNVGYTLHAFTPIGEEHGRWKQIRFNEFDKYRERWARDFIWDQDRIEPILRPYTQEMVVRAENLFRFAFIEDYMKAASKRRLEWLKNDPRKSIVLKVHAEDFVHNPKLADFLVKNFKVVLLRREDRVKQFTSWCVTQGTGVFDRTETTGPTDYKCEIGWIDFLMHNMEMFDELRGRLKGLNSVTDVSYEELTALGSPAAILKRLGVPATKQNWNSTAFARPAAAKGQTPRARNAKQMALWLRRAEKTDFKTKLRPPLYLKIPNPRRSGRTTILTYNPNNMEVKSCNT
ncbi:MAG: hypothetical protein ABL958_19485 [Bdellovibrionia bacterium]